VDWRRNRRRIGVFDGTFMNQAGFSSSSNVWAFGWIAMLQVGADFKVADHVRGGPFVGAASGQWTGPENIWHEWVFAGLRVVFDSAETMGPSHVF
jgi:hypothetical protein